MTKTCSTTPAMKFGSARDYLALCKLRVVAMMLVTVLVGMVLAAPSVPAFSLVLATLLGVGACASSAAAMNHWLDRHLDARMLRTRRRPVAEGRLSFYQVFPFVMFLGFSGFFILAYWVNLLTAWLTLGTLVGYAGVYTGYLKRATTQNIVIGGLAGAAPPLLGWTAVTNTLDPAALLLVLIIFIWTPPHFWALAIYRFEEYQSIAIPMFPVIYGIPFTKKMILWYSLLLWMVSELPFLVGMSGLLYGLSACLLGGWFMRAAWRLTKSDDPLLARKVFRDSINYLLLLFFSMLFDKGYLCLHG